jgi:UDP-N-acetylmuramoylalanine--D-glutamate ligase
VGFDPKAFRKKSAGVIGLGKSGEAAARLLLKKGFRVLVSDAKPRAQVGRRLGKLAKQVSYEGGGHSDRLLNCSFVVKSPGISPGLPIFAKLAKKKVPVFSEMEVGLFYSKTREIVAITGTNGKTTTTALTAEIFKAAGKKVRVCGNIGFPFCEEAPKAGAKDVIVCEVSSYQLEDSTAFHPRAAAILNVTSDHLDHHGTMDAYVAAKAKCFANMGPGDYGVYNADDGICMKIARGSKARQLLFGTQGHGRINAWVENGKILLQLRKETPIKLTPPDLPGRHNLDNAMAAALLAMSRGLKPSAIQKAFKKFKGVEHRIEEVGTVKGLRCVNDSKATNVDSTLVALRAFLDAKGASKNILLILGGLHKGLPYTPLKAPIERGVKAILTIGAAARKVEEDLGGGLVPIFPCGDLATAVDTAFKIGSKGEILLLSPACASFDQFKDFEDRGRQFKDLVRRMR